MFIMRVEGSAESVEALMALSSSFDNSVANDIEDLFFRHVVDSHPQLR